jgi:hypothetical protein
MPVFRLPGARPQPRKSGNPAGLQKNAKIFERIPGRVVGTLENRTQVAVFM